MSNVEGILAVFAALAAGVVLGVVAEEWRRRRIRRCASAPAQLPVKPSEQSRTAGVQRCAHMRQRLEMTVGADGRSALDASMACDRCGERTIMNRPLRVCVDFASSEPGVLGRVRAVEFLMLPKAETRPEFGGGKTAGEPDTARRALDLAGNVRELKSERDAAHRLLAEARVQRERLVAAIYGPSGEPKRIVSPDDAVVAAARIARETRQEGDRLREQVARQDRALAARSARFDEIASAVWPGYIAPDDYKLTDLVQSVRNVVESMHGAVSERDAIQKRLDAAKAWLSEVKFDIGPFRTSALLAILEGRAPEQEQPVPKTERWKCRRCGHEATIPVVSGSPWAAWIRTGEEWRHYCIGEWEAHAADRIGDAPEVTP